MKKAIFWIGPITILAILESSVALNANAESKALTVYRQSEKIGRMAAERALSLMKKAAIAPQNSNLIVITNAGHAEVNEFPTQGAIDGLISVTGASRGRNTLVEIHTSYWVPLWFAVYDKKSGFCAYLEVNPSEASSIELAAKTASPGLFTIASMERIDVVYLNQHTSEYKAKFDNRVFGGNEFRIITIANAIAAGAPTYVVRALEFHDHYCPGITSGILMTLYLKKHFPPGKSGYFIHAVEPWCKEDAFMVLLGTTPGKGNFAVSYPTDADKAARAPEAKNAATIVYRQDEQTKIWNGQILSFEWADTACQKTSDGITEKLCADLWYLQRMDKPEQFVKVLKSFDLPSGDSPISWARPGFDPLKMLGLVR
jgi:formylmethanofuran dehydrogenase subunit E-like metal-binding protein